MHPAHLQKLQKLRIGNAPQKLHPCPIGIADLPAHLVNEDLLPRLPLGWLRAIAHLIAADNQHPRLGPLFQQPGQRAHEDMIAAIRLKIAVHEGDHLIVAAQITNPRNLQPRSRIRPHRLRINPVMDHADLIAKLRRKGIGLKRRRADSRIHAGEMQIAVEVLHPQPQNLRPVRIPLKFRVKPHMRIFRRMIKLAIKPDPCLGPDIAQKHRLAPAGMRQNEIGLKPTGLDLNRRPVTGLGAGHFAVQIQQPGMHALRRARPQFIRQNLHALPQHRLLHPERQRQALMAQ